MQPQALLPIRVVGAMPPWSAEHTAGKISRPLRHCGTPYRGMNILLLWGEAMAKGYAAPIWMTFKQALELDAHVRKGEHGSLVVYANSITRTEIDESGQDAERQIPFMKGYTVFNVEQIEGLPGHYYAKPENPLPLSERIESADHFMTATGATIQHGGNSAFYAPGRDLVQMPPAHPGCSRNAVPTRPAASPLPARSPVRKGAASGLAARPQFARRPHDGLDSVPPQ
jgi:antirestriction protein ArdC